MSEDGTPEGYEKCDGPLGQVAGIPGTVEEWNRKGDYYVALGCPPDEYEDPNSELHDCDQMGCRMCCVLYRGVKITEPMSETKEPYVVQTETGPVRYCDKTTAMYSLAQDAFRREILAGAFGSQLIEGQVDEVFALAVESLKRYHAVTATDEDQPSRDAWADQKAKELGLI